MLRTVEVCDACNAEIIRPMLYVRSLLDASAHSTVTPWCLCDTCSSTIASLLVALLGAGKKSGYYMERVKAGHGKVRCAGCDENRKLSNFSVAVADYPDYVAVGREKLEVLHVCYNCAFCQYPRLAQFCAKFLAEDYPIVISFTK